MHPPLQAQRAVLQPLVQRHRASPLAELLHLMRQAEALLQQAVALVQVLHLQQLLRQLPVLHRAALLVLATDAI
jgi:hypothetical protein